MSDHFPDFLKRQFDIANVGQYVFLDLFFVDRSKEQNLMSIDRRNTLSIIFYSLVFQTII